MLFTVCTEVIMGLFEQYPIGKEVLFCNGATEKKTKVVGHKRINNNGFNFGLIFAFNKHPYYFNSEGENAFKPIKVKEVTNATL